MGKTWMAEDGKSTPPEAWTLISLRQAMRRDQGRNQHPETSAWS